MITPLIAALVLSSPSHVELVKVGPKWQLTLNGQPYEVKGVGGGASKELLVRLGGNTYRTWGADNLEKELDEAHRLGIKITIGIWLGHKQHGFRYDDPAMVAQQLETARAHVLKYRHHPALLMWALGNEMEGFDGVDDPNVWRAVEGIAKMVKELDPGRPTMTVVAEIGGSKVESIQRLCPSIDIIGINTYGGAPSVPERYAKAGGTKPYLITEFGPPGPWESPKTAWDRPIELTSTAKESWYERAHQANVVNNANLCLGSFAFLWGDKQEATSTWFSMFLPDGTRLGAVDVMQRMWTGKAPEWPCPRIASMSVEGEPSVAPGTVLTARLEASDPKGSPLTVTWELVGDGNKINLGGAEEDKPETYPGAVTESSLTGATVRMPTAPGLYRLFATVRNGHQGAATANVPLRVVAAKRR